MTRISLAGIAFDNGKVLVALRNPGTSIGESWEFPGGKLEEGESPEETLKREYLEEFDAEIEVGERICRGKFSNKDCHYTLYGYLITVKSELRLKEHSEVRWVSLRELDNLPMAASDRQLAECLKNR
ncbi:MAG: NUDIX hydrolase [Spirochaetes bacterium]|nr:MAG: NUDIX hydrolase [Spirochaetota bacterium]